ncbi:hypothetical protein CRE_03665 [Caenorhabditis remanei]|uniref:tRNA (32-2'-O)-methyltransferase regulator THADA n=1 Tax=Caenorhabditis remanei TaxID=31234 RepID=E3LXK2_CAERE|nr:hypothetical protein CRE_03665 [Caenorhabditis remanei]
MPVRVAGKAIRDLEYLHSKVILSDLFDGNSPKIYKDLERTLEASEKYLNDNDTVIFASATLKRILVIIQESKKPLPGQYWNPIILHIRRIWDYTADRVCHDSVDTFALLLELHLRQCVDCLDRPATDSHANCDWINEITQWLLEPTSLCRSRFRCITHLVVQCPTLRLNLGEDFFHRTYPLLSNPTFSSVIFQLIVDNIFDRDELWDYHCEMLLTSIDAKLIKSRLIPMIQKYHPSNTASTSKQKQQKPLESDTGVKFLNQLLIQLNSPSSQSDLQSRLEIVHALVVTTWPKKKMKDNEPANLIDFSNWTQCITDDTMSAAIVHVNTDVRLAAFKLVVENPRKTIAFNETDIEYIKTFLASNMTIQSPSSRQQLIAAYKFMCQRMGASAEVPMKTVMPTELDSDSFSPDSSSFESRGLSKWRFGKDANLHPIPESYIALARWMAKLAFESLSPKANYYRRIMALMQIDTLFTKENFITDGKNLFADKLNLDSTLGSDRHKLVLDCLDDSYDLVQTIALSLLKRLDFGNIKMNEEKYLNDAVELMTSTRSRNATSAGFRMQYYLARQPERYAACFERFMDDLKKRTEAAEIDLLSVTTLPVHSILNMIELLLRNPSGLEEDSTEFYRNQCLDKLLPICHKIVSIVSPVVHSLSPEGCIPDEMLRTMCGKSTDRMAELSQHLLVCCWRAHKHVSGIFSWVVETLAPKEIVTKEEIEAIGTFYWTQLTECKHRGAFESATEGFSQLCTFLWNTTIEGLPKPMEWLDEILSAIRGEKDLTNLCSTRRSAGLPHLVLSIVATEPKTNENEALTKATDSLLNMEGKAAEYRVHSMNVMKTMIQSSTLHERAVYCYGRTLRVAIDACRADWSERNAASQLFAALRTKIFGVMRSAQRTLSVDPKNRKSNYEFFSKFPSLYKFLYDQLQMEQSEFSLLPPLVVLSHLYTPSSSSDLYPLGSFIKPLLVIALRDKRENIRAHAVAAILAISDVYAKEDLCRWVGQFEFKNARQNHIHSFLLLLEGLGGYVEYVGRIVFIVENILASLEFKKWCDFNINQLLIIANSYGLEYDVDEITVDQVCLSKRPLAVKILGDRDAFKSEMCRMLRNVDTRREVYRTIYKQGWDSCNKFLRAHIINIAIKDLSSPDIQQCDAKRIMEILTYVTDEFMSKENAQKMVEVVEKRLEDPENNWTLPSTMAYATKLKYGNYLYPDYELITWIRESYELDDPETKQIALDVGGRFIYRVPSKRSYTDQEKDLIAAVALYLQDESDFIRQRTSCYLGHLVRNSGDCEINPEICRLLIIKWCLNDGNENLERFSTDKKRRVEDRDDLFDACAVNQFEEYQLFGDIPMYEVSIGFNGYNQEMYDIEY